MSDDRGIPWLTEPLQDFLAHLSVITLLPQMQEDKPDRGYTYAGLFNALSDLAEAGEVDLVGDEQDVYVVIHDQVIVHAARGWLEYMAPRWHAADSASN
jgi:hypothetical protein